MQSDQQGEQRAFRTGIGVIVCLLVMLAGAQPSRFIPEIPSGSIIELRAMDSKSAILLWEYKPLTIHERFWISRLDSNGEVQWWQELPAEPLRDGTLVSSSLVAVRYMRGSDLAVIAFDRDGRRLWDRVIGSHATPRYNVPFGLIVGDDLLQITGAAENTQLHLIDGRTGELAWTEKWTRELDDWSPAVHGQQVVLQNYWEALLVDLRRDISARIRRVPPGGCIVDGRYISLQSTDSLVRTDLQTFGSTLLTQVPGLVRLVRCGTYRGRIVVFADTRDFQAGVRGTRVLVLDANGTVTGARELPGDLRSESREAHRFMEQAPFGGELPRYVPYVWFTLDGARRFVLIDLETASVSPPLHVDWNWPRLFRSGDRWYFVEHGEPFAVINGNTGTIDAAVEAPGMAGVGMPHVGHGLVWLYSRKHTRLTRPPYAVLDGNTLQPIRSRSLRIEDARDSWASKAR